jgi:hypothetical protein
MALSGAERQRRWRVQHPEKHVEHQRAYRERRRSPEHELARRLGVSVKVIERAVVLGQARPQLYQAILARSSAEGLTVAQTARVLAAAAWALREELVAELERALQGARAAAAPPEPAAGPLRDPT